MAARKIEDASDDPPGGGDWKTSGEYRVVRMAPTGSVSVPRILANEAPVAIEFDGQPYAVMMATPADLEDFAVGFAAAERIVGRAADIARIDIREGARGIGIDIRLEKEHAARLIKRRRAIAGQSGCGICGLTTIEEALPPLDPLEACPSVEGTALFEALERLPLRQTLNQATGAVHAAAFCSREGDILAVREDVGRHNALDKVVGHLLRAGLDASSGFALLTSRCSYELVQKAVLARIPMLVAISAPTELAMTMAVEARLTLIALARRDSVLLFNDPFGVFGSGSSPDRGRGAPS